jgi:hypothetical protein
MFFGDKINGMWLGKIISMWNCYEEKEKVIQTRIK